MMKKDDSLYLLSLALMISIGANTLLKKKLEHAIEN